MGEVQPGQLSEQAKHIQTYTDRPPFTLSVINHGTFRYTDLPGVCEKNYWLTIFQPKSQPVRFHGRLAGARPHNSNLAVSSGKTMHPMCLYDKMTRTVLMSVSCTIEMLRNRGVAIKNTC